jgi:hypothetical protein
MPPGGSQYGRPAARYRIQEFSGAAVIAGYSAGRGELRHHGLRKLITQKPSAPGVPFAAGLIACLQGNAGRAKEPPMPPTELPWQ